MRNSIVAVTSSFVVSMSAYATFLPPNNLHLEDHLNVTANIDQKQFDAIIASAADVYGPVIKAKGKKLVTNNLWTSSTVNASAQQSGNNWILNMYGGLARRAEVTKDGFLLVVCHELGHHLAGFPFVSSWAADEGQSDYFATLACAREIWMNDDEENAKSRDTVGEYVQDLCDKAWASETDQNICYRAMAAGHSLGTLLGALGGNAKVEYDQPDKSKVARTNHAHPQAQCRLDTYMAGALCVADWDIDLIPKTEAQSRPNVCTEADQFEMGTRPLCWFKPTL